MRVASCLAALALVASATSFAQLRPLPLSRADTRFLQKAAEDGIAEVELGRLAQEKGLRDEVKQFASRMVTDHGNANEALMQIAGTRGIQLPTTLDDKHRKHFEHLQKLTGPDFDRVYMKHMLEDHKHDVKEFERKAKDSKDEEVREFAQKTATTLRSHLAAARGTYDLTAASKRTGERETGAKK